MCLHLLRPGRLSRNRHRNRQDHRSQSGSGNRFCAVMRSPPDRTSPLKIRSRLVRIFRQYIGESPFLDASGLVTPGSLKPDIGDDGAQLFCEAILHEASPHGVALTVSTMHGAALDDEEHSPVEEMVKLVRSAGFVEHFQNEPWYTTRLGPTAEDPDFLTQTADGTTHSVTDDDERWYRNPLPELSHPIQQALASIFHDWNPELASRAYLKSFLTERMAPFIREDVLDAIPWDDLTTLGMIYYYHSLIETAHTENWNLDTARDLWVTKLDDEAFLAKELISDVIETPLESEARLLEEFDYASVEEARNNLLAQVQYAYETFDIQPPEDLHEWSVLQLANEYHSLLSNVFLPYRNWESDTENSHKADDFVHGFSIVNFTVLSPEETLTRLDGSHQEPNLDLVFFVASIFIEPLDWVMTGEQMIRAAEEEDWWLFAVSGVLLLLPFATGKLAKGLSKSDEAVDVARVSRRALAASGSNYIQQADGLFAIPGYPGKKDLREQLMRAAEYDPSLAWRAPSPHIYEEAHHLVPQGHRYALEAREILEAKSIPLHSYHNGVALPEHIHDLTERKDYVTAVNSAILQFEDAPREVIVSFLDDLARRFGDIKLANVRR